MKCPTCKGESRERTAPKSTWMPCGTCHGEGVLRGADLRRYRQEQRCAKIARRIEPLLPEGTGFALLLFDFGKKGNFSYVSSAQRADMIKMLLEAAEKLSGDLGGN